MRASPIDAPFALTHTQNNIQKIYCLNARAEDQGIHRGMSFSDARVRCLDLQTAQANPREDVRFLQTLTRWAGRYCPWVGTDNDGLVMDVTGSTHLLGGEVSMLEDIRARLNRAGLSHSIGLADTRGAAWALARFGGGVSPPGQTLRSVGPLPVAALRIGDDVHTALQRLGLRTIQDLTELPRVTLARRFGPGLLLRLDQALGDQPETVSPQSAPPHFATRMTLPEPIGLVDDLMQGLERILEPLCARLADQHMGARCLQLSIRRVDQASSQIEIRLARPMRDATRILRLFEREMGKIDAGFGIDQLRLMATETEALPERQITHQKTPEREGFSDLMTRIGNRIGLENITRYLPADSTIPEKEYITAYAAYSEPASGGWAANLPRPLLIFPPETIAGTQPIPPKRFRWRRMSFSAAQASGPERITPEWWLDDPNWRSGMRDYWRIDTYEGRRLWLFFTPQQPRWFVQGEFA